MDTTAFLAQERDFFLKGKRRSVKERLAMLRKLRAALVENREKINSALYDDLRKSEYEAGLTEFMPLLRSIDYFLSHLKRLDRPERVGSGLLNFPARSSIRHDPYGLVLVISTWNYPLLLSLDPLVGAVAAGNSVVLKCSQNAPSTARLLCWLLNECFGSDCVLADETDSTETLLKEKFDLIFFTGGEKGGRAVAAAAAATLTPVILELGGKNPCFVDASADLDLAAKRIVWGKFLNAGQTCVAPDYLLVQSSVRDELMIRMRKYITEFYGENPEESDDYGRIVNQERYQSLLDLMKEGRLIAGGEKDPEEHYIAPTILDGIAQDSPLMRQEIFGPVLPVFSFEEYGEAIARVNAGAKPLAIYCFSRDRRAVRKLLEQTVSGTAAINDVVVQLANRQLPFGGVGASGMGAYHGKYSYAAFSHAKSVLYQHAWFDFPLRYPPVRGWKRKLLAWFCR